MLNDGRPLMTVAPWLVWFPGIAILLTVLCVNFVGDGLRDALDPTQRRVRT
jgi:peptide/nickel transport system permease protein